MAGLNSDWEKGEELPKRRIDRYGEFNQRRRQEEKHAKMDKGGEGALCE